MKNLLSTPISLLVLACMTNVALAESSYKSQYRGEEHRAIKSLSEEDISELREGAGWGFAKPAELNGLPGPIHVLQMAEEIGLSEEQHQAITDIYDEMKSMAIPLGLQMIELETELDVALARREIDQQSLERVVSRIAQVQGQLRYVHLAAHLKTPEVLSENQVALYNELRGYSNDPCANIPQGHDASRWRAHNGCD